MIYNELDLIILKALITNKKFAIDFVSDNNDAKLFQSETWNFANIITNYVRVHKDLPTLRVITEKLSKGNNDKLIENIKHTWEEVSKTQYDDKEYKHDLEKIKKRYAEKQISLVKETFTKFEPGSMDINRAVSEMQKTLQNIKSLSGAKTHQIKNLKDALPEFTERFNRIKNNPELETGLKTGYSFLDFSCNGYKPADFILIAGASGFGKSLLLMNMFVQIWMQGNKIEDTEFKNGKDVVFFSLEMPFEDCFNRILARLSGIPIRKIEMAKLNKEEFNKIKQCLDFINKYPYQLKIVDIESASANDIENILVNCDQKFDAIFVDYLGIMNPNQSTEEQDWLKQAIIAQEVRAIARRYNVPIFSAVQLNRKGEGKDASESIGLNRLARSHGIATHATTVVQIENRINEDNYPDFIYHIIKQRKGIKGKGRLIKNLACAMLLDIPLESDEDKNYDKYFINQDDISDQLEDLSL